MSVTFRRDDFQPLSDGSNIFDSILENTDIPDKHHSRIHELTVRVSHAEDVFDEDGKQLGGSDWTKKPYGRWR